MVVVLCIQTTHLWRAKKWYFYTIEQLGTQAKSESESYRVGAAFCQREPSCLPLPLFLCACDTPTHRWRLCSLRGRSSACSLGLCSAPLTLFRGASSPVLSQSSLSMVWLTFLWIQVRSSAYDPAVGSVQNHQSRGDLLCAYTALLSCSVTEAQPRNSHRSYWSLSRKLVAKKTISWDNSTEHFVPVCWKHKILPFHA